ncbi:hypothetical protein BMF94_3436 [Rhodotorula taiwanensis]|uniref:AAA+ ATPase domain-containing protein n=1 Tax=Rhodotorula taiwanensis TaxID=741276 RepID=A0A2S5B9R3_9BASI|nr:hypothetical protein BMF94_3436 [Rhodotorula taiwanensis]
MSASQPLLHLNRQLSGMAMGSSRQRQTLSLNQPSPLGQPATPEMTASDQDPAPTASTSALPATTATTAPTSGDPAPAAAAAAPKRRLRPSTSSRDPSTPKRLRGAAAGTTGRDASATGAASFQPPSTRLADLGGVDSCIEQMLELVALPLMHPEVYLHTGVRPPRGVLLVGPPGCGKTMLAGAIAGELQLPFISISAPSVVSGMSGESEKTLRETFEEAARQAPCILFIDEIDAITPKRETAQREMERRIVAQLLTCMDDLAWDKTENKPVVVIAATNRPDSLDPALRRAGRFDAEITMGVPDQAGRERILRVLMAKLRLSGDFDYARLAKETPGYVGADLSALTGAAGVLAVKRIFETLGVNGDEGRRVGTGIPLDLATAEGALAALVRPDSGSSAEDADMTMADAVPAPAVATPPLDPGSVPSSIPGSGATTPRDEGLPGSDAALLAAAVPALPFSSLPPSLANLPISAFLRAHPAALTEDQLSTIALTNADFVRALSIVQPSSQREGFTTVPDVTWDDLGALHHIREEMRMSIVRPIRRPDVFKLLGLNAPCGVLLWGPPGCGKTLLAKAVANESRANFISVKGPELLNKYVGESERAVRQVFARARASSPCIIFFDELDAMVPRRDDSLSESSARLVNTLLTELDGLESRKQVFVIGATNRPDILDPAMCRPGRLDKLLYVDLPSPAERIEVLRAVTRKTPMADDVNLEKIATATKADGLSGADLSALAREAAVSALREMFTSIDLDGPALDVHSAIAVAGQPVEPPRVSMRHFETALERANPSVSRQQRRRFEALRRKFAGSPLGHKGEAVEQDGPDGEQQPAETAVPFNNVWRPYEEDCSASQLFQGMIRGDTTLRSPASSDGNIRYPWLMNATVLLVGDSMERLHLNDFCDLVGGEAINIHPNHLASPPPYHKSIKPVFGADGLETAESKMARRQRKQLEDAWERREHTWNYMRPWVCDVKEYNFTMLFTFAWGMEDMESVFQSEDFYHAPSTWLERFHHIALPLLHNVAHYLKRPHVAHPTLIEISSGYWDLRGMTEQDFIAAGYSRPYPKDSDLAFGPIGMSRERKWVKNVRKVIKDVAQTFPGSNGVRDGPPILWRTMHHVKRNNYTPYSRVAALDALARKTMHELRLSSLATYPSSLSALFNSAPYRQEARKYLAREKRRHSGSGRDDEDDWLESDGIDYGFDERLRVDEIGRLLEGQEHHMRDDLHPQVLPGSYVWADILLYELKRSYYRVGRTNQHS